MELCEHLLAEEERGPTEIPKILRVYPICHALYVCVGLPMLANVTYKNTVRVTHNV
jgi:hypothetical protein